MLSSVLSATSKTSPDHHTKYWNRELRSKIQVNTERKVVRQAKIISLSDPDDKKSAALNLLPEGATLLAVGVSFDAFDIEALKVQQPNIIFASHRTVR